MAAGGGKKKGFLQSCLTSTVALIVGVYVIVLIGTALVKTFIDNGGSIPFPQFSSAPSTNQNATTASNPAPSDAQAYNPNGSVKVTASQGSNAAGGSEGGQANGPQGPRQINVAYSARYIVEQGDVYRNGLRITFDESVQLIANKLLTTPADLKKVNPNTLGKGIIYPGMVISIPDNVVIPTNPTPGPLPGTGLYADPENTDSSDNPDPSQ